MKYDRFNLEEEIQNVWQTKDDLNAISVDFENQQSLTVDEVNPVLIGLAELHEIRCKKLWRVFEHLVKEKGFK